MKRMVLGSTLIAVVLAFLVYASVTPILFAPWWVNVLVTFVAVGMLSTGIILAGKGFESREKAGTSR